MGRSGWLLAGFLLLTGCGVHAVTVAPGFDPITLQGRAGGTVNIGLCGYIAHRPNHRIWIAEDLDYAKLVITEPLEVMVLVRGPDGSFCGTPIHAQPAQISGYWKAGMYEVFVGSSQANATPHYRLLLTGER